MQCNNHLTFFFFFLIYYFSQEQVQEPLRFNLFLPLGLVIQIGESTSQLIAKFGWLWHCISE